MASAKFCSMCECYLWLELDEENKLTYHCKNCGNQEEHTNTLESLCVLDNNYIDDNTSYTQYTTKFLKYDPTLPRVNNIECANSSCPTHHGDAEKEVIFVKYDFENMKYLYHCVHCNEFWRSSSQAVSKK